MCARQYKRKLGAFLAVSLPFVVSACAGLAIKQQFRHDFQCNERPTVDSMGGGKYEVKGCTTTAIYDCSGGPCVVVRSEDLLDESSPSSETASQSVPRTTGARRIKLQQEDLTIVNVTLRLDASTWLNLRAAPEKYGERVQIKLSREDFRDSLKGCELDWIVNGQRLEAPEATVAVRAAQSSLRGDLSRSMLRELGVARQFALKACDNRWTLTPQQLQEIHRFVELYEEELAWQGGKRGTTAGMMAPQGGWPNWQALDALPADIQAAALTGTDLFKLVSPSVFQLEVQTTGGTLQGSAVAVTTNELLTNCHVLEGARRIIVRQGEDEAIGRLMRADPETDRCIISVKDRTLTAIRGVRSQANLEVGEPLYTLGSPNGLEQTLGNGILSGIREVEGRSYVQTSAPISPGSSGGGLFDARGNLVGITTLVLAGRERLNQSLNFAIPAESFYKP